MSLTPLRTLSSTPWLRLENGVWLRGRYGGSDVTQELNRGLDKGYGQADGFACNTKLERAEKEAPAGYTDQGSRGQQARSCTYSEKQRIVNKSNVFWGVT